MTPEGGLARVVAEHQWYHSIELEPGLVTPGWFDTRSVAGTLPWPDLRGKRCLDVGTFDGFWAFEMERRGAAEVVAVDVPDPNDWDWPAASDDAERAVIADRKAAGEGFLIARDALGSRVERRDMSVYRLDAGEVGTFDFVYVGSLLVHLRDPVGALMAVRGVCRGRLLVVDAVDPYLTARYRRPVAWLDGRGRPWWWKANRAGIVRMMEAAGFTVVGRPQRVWMRPGSAQGGRPGLGDLRLLRHGAGRESLLWRTAGDPHVAVVAEA